MATGSTTDDGGSRPQWREAVRSPWRGPKLVLQPGENGNEAAGPATATSVAPALLCYRPGVVTSDRQSPSESRGELNAFITRWQASGAAERANYQLFLSELCDVLGVPRPDPAVPDDSDNAYVFERAVTFHHADGTTANGRIDLYRRGCFVLEAKQGADVGTDGIAPARRGHGVRGTPAWDDAMVRARGQAEQYLRALPAEEPTPPFLVVVDVGHSLELYADFTRSGRTFLPFPDARSHRLPLARLADDEVRERLRLVWTDPDALDPARRSARVTRDIASRLARLARDLEAGGHAPDDVAHFLMRCLFTMFAEDVGLLPARSFTGLLEELREEPDKLAPLLESLWQTMRTGGMSPVLREFVPQFNGGLFESCHAVPVNRAQAGLLWEAARADWRDVEPAIFGTLLERALDPDERHRLGAHFTPRAYVERLVLPTVVEPLRAEWQGVFTAAATLARQGKADEAQREVRAFLDRLCSVRVLDPACGSGNFLYVTLEHLKRLEGEVVDALEGFGDSQQRLDLAGTTVDPHQLLGLEINPRAAAIAELVLWIGYLQWHLRNRSTPPPEPILRAFHTIECRDAVLAYDFPPQPRRDENGDPITQWDGRTFKKHPVTGEDVPDESARVPVWDYPNARQAEWPEADFVVGNPPFIGNKRMRSELGDGYVETLREVWPEVPGSADYVMYWWHRAAELTRAGALERFGLITTNSITQVFNRKVVQHHLDADPPLSIVFAVPDHPWVDSADGAAVRVAMTSAAEGGHWGTLSLVDAETSRDAGEYIVELQEKRGRLNSNLTVGVDVTSVDALRSNDGVCFQGFVLVGKGFLLSTETAARLEFPVDGSHPRLRPWMNGRDLLQTNRGQLVIDLFGLSETAARAEEPRLYNHLLTHVKPMRDQVSRKGHREKWWIWGEARPGLREATTGLQRIIVTNFAAKHRLFVFSDPRVAIDHNMYVIALPSAYHLGVLSSRAHFQWMTRVGSSLEDRRLWISSTCFRPFPFASANEETEEELARLAEQLDAHRKRQQAAHPGLTLTNMYNVLEKLRTGEALNPKEREVHEQGLVSVLAEIHDRLDEAVLAAYGWSDLAPALVGKPGGTTPNPDVSPEQAEAEEELLARLVALNAERAEEERRGIVRWLRPEYQAPGAAAPEAAEQEDLDLEDVPAASPPPAGKQPWPSGLAAQANAVRDALAAAGAPLDRDQLAARFTRARKQTLAEILETLVALGHAREMEDGRYAG